MKELIDKYREKIRYLESELEKAQNALCDIDAILDIDNFTSERSFLETEKECKQIISKVLDL